MLIQERVFPQVAAERMEPAAPPAEAPSGGRSPYTQRYPEAIGRAKPWLAGALRTLRGLSERNPQDYLLAQAFRDALTALRALNRANLGVVLSGWSECPACSSLHRDEDARCVFCGHTVPPPPLTDDQLLELVADQLTTESGDDGIGAGEFHGQRGTDRRPFTRIAEGVVEVDVTDFARGDDELPEVVHGTHDGLAFVLHLGKVFLQGGRWVARYEVEAL